jgi:hypothetical protein
VKSTLEIDQMWDRQALTHARSLTPAHAAAEGAIDEGAETAEQLRRRVQHEADPYTEPAEAPEVAGKAFRDAYEVPAEYPQVPPVPAEAFRRGPIRAGHDALSPGYEPPLSFPLPAVADHPGPGCFARTPMPGTGPGSSVSVFRTTGEAGAC